MNTQMTTQAKVSWTWADQFLTYRFWGLLLFYVLSAASSNLVSTWLFLFIEQQSLGSSSQLVGILFAVMALGVVWGFFIAWGATRWKAKAMLVLAGLLQLAGALLLTLPGLGTSPLRFVGAFLIGLGVGAVTLGVPAILANGLGGAQAFVVAFGVLFTISRLEQFYSGVGVAPLWVNFGPMVLTVGASALVLLGILFLLPVKPALFSEPPTVRTYNWIPTKRNPLIMALGSIFPPIYFYLIYKYHGEVASLQPSPKLLSPWGAVGATFVPLLFPVMMSTLIEPLNQRAVEQGKCPLRAPWVIFVWSILFYPVAIGLIQSALNRSIEAA